MAREKIQIHVLYFPPGENSISGPGRDPIFGSGRFFLRGGKCFMAKGKSLHRGRKCFRFKVTSRQLVCLSKDYCHELALNISS